MTTDDPGSPPERPVGPARRSRRAGRTSESYDFRARFGDPSVTERRAGLHEPVNRPSQVPGRERVTVRELMAQMAAGPTLPPPVPPVPPVPPAPPGTPIPRLPEVPVQRQSTPQPSTPQPSTPQTPAAWPPVEVTQWMPPVEAAAPTVDLSEETTTRRAQAESRGQVAPA
ncbi:MAG: LytR family transcriptional regulator, partial [Gordonia sp. (in: high G+C Gram-positive bacteria)]